MTSSTRAVRRPSNSSACRPQPETDCPQITQIHPIENNVGPPIHRFQTADYEDRRRSLPTTASQPPRHQGAVTEWAGRFRFFPAERQTIRDRLPPVRSSRAPNASICRRCASHRPTCQRHVGSASFLCCCSRENGVSGCLRTARTSSCRRTEQDSLCVFAPLRLCVRKGGQTARARG